MKNAKIFLVEEDMKLTPMTETTYVKEEDMQALLEKFPDLLPGDQIDLENPRRWLLIARELGVPGSEDGTNRWSLDHLFLDQDGIPTFVECKRSSDTRSRREVVAQMLDYAANGIIYWKMDVLHKAAEDTAQKSGKDLDKEILKLIESDDPSRVNNYWKLVEKNLKSGSVRLIFVADTIPTELRRLVEFLNEQMVSTQVLSIELKQYIGENHQKAIVRRLIGMTETARDVKQRSKTNLEEFRSRCTPETYDFFIRVLDIVNEHRHTISWNTSGFSVRLYIPEMEGYVSIAYGYPPDIFQIYFGHLLLPDEQMATLRKEILAYQVFKEAPKTLSTKLGGGRTQKTLEAFELMLKKVEAIASTPNQ